MAANFWKSTQYAYMTNYAHNEETWHKKDIETLGLTAEDCRTVEFFCMEQLWELASSLSVRSRLAATASVYFRKFYVEYSFCEMEPSLVAATSLNLAAKIEESPIRQDALLNSAKFTHSYTMVDIQNCEVFMLSALRCNLIVFHPYRTLLRYAEDAKLDRDVTDYALSLVNDSYFTDALLRYPPYLISLACLLIAVTKRQVPGNHFRTWINNVIVDKENAAHIGDLCNDILNVYTFLASPDFDLRARKALEKIKIATAKPK